MSASLVTLEGDRQEGGLHLLEESFDSYLLGDDETEYRYRVTLEGDSIEQMEYSPLRKQYVNSNNGIIEANETFIPDPNNPAIFWHTDNDGNLLGCSVCVEDELLGSDDGETLQYFYHFNLDGTLAGYSLPSEENESYITLAGVEELGFFKGFKMKMPKLKMPKIKMPKFKMPKIKLPKFKMPKIKIPKIKLPKIKLPKIKIPKLKLPKISLPKIKLPKLKMPDLSKIGKGISKIGNNIGNAIDTGLSKVGEAATQFAEFNQGLIESGMNMVNNLMPGGGGMMPDGMEDPSGGTPTDYTQPGYQDETGYTADDGMFYLHDGTGYLNPQTNEWFNMDGTPYGETAMDYTQPGYEDETGYTANDGMYYLHDGTGFLNPQTNEWFNIDGTPWGSETQYQDEIVEDTRADRSYMLYGYEGKELGIDPMTISALMPMASSVLNNFTGGKPIMGVSTNQLMNTAQQFLRPPPPRPVARPTSTVVKRPPPPPPRTRAVSKPSLPTTQPLIQQRALFTDDKDEKDKKLMIYGVGAVLGLGAIYLITQNKGRGRK